MLALLTVLVLIPGAVTRTGAAGIVELVADINPTTIGMDSSYPYETAVFNSKLYISAYKESYGVELWVWDGTNPPSLVADIYPGELDSGVSELIVYNNKLYFMADDGNSSGTELWVYDGVNPPSMARRLTLPGSAAAACS